MHDFNFDDFYCSDNVCLINWHIFCYSTDSQQNTASQIQKKYKYIMFLEYQSTTVEKEFFYIRSEKLQI